MTPLEEVQAGVDSAMDSNLDQREKIGEIFRARYRKSFETPEPVVADRPEHYTIDLRWNDHRFPKGHKIMVQIQSTWFPLTDRNPQKFMEIPKALSTDFMKATR